MGLANSVSAVGAAPAMTIHLRASWSMKSVSAAPTVLVRVAVPTQASRPGLYLADRPFGPGSGDNLYAHGSREKLPTLFSQNQLEQHLTH